MKPSTVIIGAGPAGLTAAYHLATNGFPVTVLEADPQYVGGISRTVSYNGFHFDIGGHRFFSKAERIEALLARATDELVALGLAAREDIVDGCVVRQKKAYPVYDDAYAQHVQVIRDGLRERYAGLHLAGRNGMHKYNNQDHAMMTALLCAENIMAGRDVHDVWLVNEDAEYHEEVRPGNGTGASGLRAVPRRVSA